MPIAKRLASRLPVWIQQELKRQHLRRHIARGVFRSEEPEFDRLDDWVRQGDCVLDVGANVGHYTLELARLVGPTGRVIAFEPIPPTFELLAANCALAPYRNITLVNAAASDQTRTLRMAVPEFEATGLKNFYQAQVSSEVGPEQGYSVMALAIDALRLDRAVSLVKIDVEGHELEVAEGMKELLQRDRPTVIVEGVNALPLLTHFGYTIEQLGGSPNMIACPSGR